ncbi:hypothetical protein HPB50_029221 [Hyalomma asiaticum]|nr:hypothetical protein HPB50_029221 [Hyalomma asiaticum]
MSIRLNRDHRWVSFDEQLKSVGGPSNVTELDLTNFFRPNPKELFLQIQQCVLIRTLRCLNCAITPHDIILLLVQELPFLVEVEFSLACETFIDVALLVRMHEGDSGSVTLRPSLLRMYVDVCHDPCFQMLRKLLLFFPSLKDLHVHMSHGMFSTAVTECSAILEERDGLETFAFTSDLPPPYLQQLVRPLGFMAYASMCANVVYRKYSDTWNCVPLDDLASDSGTSRNLPCHLVLTVVDDQDKDLTAEAIRVATLRNNWSAVRHLCLLLLPADPLSIVYPTAALAHHESLRYFFKTALDAVTELNISHFHFGLYLDLKDVLQVGSLGRLRSLSAPPCALLRLSDLRLLAQCCPELEELDVRFEKKGHFQRCAGCEHKLPLDPADIHGERSAYAAGFRNPLSKLTLSDGILSRMDSLEHLYLLSGLTYVDSEAETSVLELSKLPALLFLHVHYRTYSNHTMYKRITWTRQSGASVVRGILVKMSACFPACSPATFIGLSKPLNRDF